MATDQILDTPAPECDHSKGLPAVVSEKGRERAIEARLAAQVADAEWLSGDRVCTSTTTGTGTTTSPYEMCDESTHRAHLGLVCPKAGGGT
jgi:hypothetical protein